MIEGIRRLHSVAVVIGVPPLRIILPIEPTARTLGKGWGLSYFRHAHRGRMKTMPQFQTQVRHPLTDHLPELLSAGRLRDPTVWILFFVFIAEDRLKGSAMQVEVDDIRRCEGGQG
jgi:hypothetical protein